MAIALLPPLDDDRALDDARAAPHLRQSAARLVRAAAMRELAQAARERSRELLLDDHDRRLRMRAWMQESAPAPAREPQPAQPRAASTASRTRSDPKRTTSSVTRPVCSCACSTAARAAASSRPEVFSATATTRAGFTQPAADS